MCYAVCVEKMIRFDNQNCHSIMVLWYNIIHSYYIFHILFFIILNKKCIRFTCIPSIRFIQVHRFKIPVLVFHNGEYLDVAFQKRYMFNASLKNRDYILSFTFMCPKWCWRTISEINKMLYLYSFIFFF